MSQTPDLKQDDARAAALWFLVAQGLASLSVELANRGRAAGLSSADLAAAVEDTVVWLKDADFPRLPYKAQSDLMREALQQFGESLNSAGFKV